MVVTNHAPHPGSVAPRCADDPLTAGFASDLDDLIRTSEPTLWVHGHVHDGFDHRVGATRVLANPSGCGPRFHRDDPLENRAFDGGLIVDLPRSEAAGRDGLAAAHPRADLRAEVLSFEAMDRPTGACRTG